MSLDVERTDGFRDAWKALLAKLGIVANSTVRNNVSASTAHLGITGPTPSVDLLVEAFRNATIGFARSVLRDQILAARTFLDNPLTPADLGDKPLKVWQREQLLKTFDVYENRMRLVSTNELLQLNASLNKSRQVQAGVRQYVWTTCLDDRVRARHQSLEGTVQTWGHPPDPGFDPGEDYNCRCLAFPIIDDTYFLVRNQAFA